MLILPSPGGVLERIPEGTSVDGIRPYIASMGLGDGEAMLWLPTKERADDAYSMSHEDGSKIETPYGVFIRADIGDYDVWKATPAERARFTGDLFFFRRDLLGNAQEVEFQFVNGKLIGTDWEWLPS